MRILYKISLWLTSVAIMAAITSCEAVMDGERPCPAGESVSLSFKMITSTTLVGTRADDNPFHSEVDSEFRQFEDGIDVNDLGLFIFAKDIDGVDQLVMKTTNISSSTNPAMMITGSPGAYTVTMIVEKDNLTKILGYEIDANSDENVDFRIMILANCKNAISGGWNAIDGMTFTEVVTQAQSIAFPMEAIHNTNMGDSEVDGVYKGNIPMFGTNTFTVSQQDLFLSRPDERIWLGQIDMLRSLAKVRVIDNIQNKDDSGYPKIIAAEILSSQSAAIPVPFDAVGYRNGYQVHTANIAEPEKALTLEGASVYKLGSIPSSWDMTPEADRTGNTHIGYIPEQKIANINGNVAQGMPVFRITAALKKNLDGTDDTKTYDVPMTGYNVNNGGLEFTFGNEILRNHVYSLSVNRVAVGTPAEITVTVDNWNESSLTLDYTESILVSNPLSWVPNTFENTAENGSVIIVKPWATTENGSTWIPLVGTFGFQSPIGARWTAYLLTTVGDEDSFAFMDESNPDDYGNPSLVPSISGIIDGKTLSTLKIVTLDPAPEQQNRARLQILVTIGEGSSATVTEAEAYGNIDYFTIVQNPL